MPGSQRRRPRAARSSSPSTARPARASPPSRGSLAARLGLEYLDTGAMYRAVCWACLERGHRPRGRPPRSPSVARGLDLEVGTDPDAPVVRVDGLDVARRDPRDAGLRRRERRRHQPGGARRAVARQQRDHRGRPRRSRGGRRRRGPRHHDGRRPRRRRPDPAHRQRGRPPGPPGPRGARHRRRAGARRHPRPGGAPGRRRLDGRVSSTRRPTAWCSSTPPASPSRRPSRPCSRSWPSVRARSRGAGGKRPPGRARR